MRGSAGTGAAGVSAAFLGSLCCAGPLLFVTLGVGAGLASTFAPLRPLFGAAMLGLFSYGFYRHYSRRNSDASVPGRGSGSNRAPAGGGAACELPRRGRMH